MDTYWINQGYYPGLLKKFRTAVHRMRQRCGELLREEYLKRHKLTRNYGISAALAANGTVLLSVSGIREQHHRWAMVHGLGEFSLRSNQVELCVVCTFLHRCNFLVENRFSRTGEERNAMTDMLLSFRRGALLAGLPMMLAMVGLSAAAQSPARTCI